MNSIIIQEITSAQIHAYKHFFHQGLVLDEDSFRITPNDDAHAPFPTNDTPDSFTLGAYEEGTLRGVVSFMRDGMNREKLRHKGILFRMYCAPQARGRGIGARLIDEVLLRARKLGDIERINLTVVAHNTAARALYEKFGFRLFATEDHAIYWKGQYYTECQMALQL